MAVVTEAETWSGSRIRLDPWCPRDVGFFVAPMPTPLAAWIGPTPGRNYEPGFVVLHPLADGGPVMAANLAASHLPAGVGEIVGGWS